MKTELIKLLITFVIPFIFKQLNKMFNKKIKKMSGFEKLKEALIRLARFGNEFGLALEDGKIKLAEVMGFFDNLVGFLFIVNNWQEIKLEFEDLDESEKLIINEAIAEELNLSNDKTEKIIEKGFAAAMSLHSFYLAFKSE